MLPSDKILVELKVSHSYACLRFAQSEIVKIRLQKIRWIVSGSSSFCPPLLYDWLSIREISVRGLYKEKQQY